MYTLQNKNKKAIRSPDTEIYRVPEINKIKKVNF